MLAQMLKEHNQGQNLRKEMQGGQAELLSKKGCTERLKNEAIVAVHNLSAALVDHLNTKVGVAYHNEKKLDVEGKRFDQNSSQLSRQTDEWISLAESLNHALKDIGDVEHSARIIECDLEQITQTLQRISTRKDETTNED